MTRHFGGINPVKRNDSARYIIILSAFLLVVCSFVAVIFLSSGSSDANQPTTVVIHEPQIEMAEILIPIQRIEQGAMLEPSMFRKENRPKVGLSAGAIRDLEQIQGQYAKALILPDQPLHEEYITRTRPINAITQKIPDGFRAVTIRVDAKTAVEGWAVPGVRVDVVWASQVAGKQALTVIVENSMILSADKNVDSNAKGGPPIPSTITLLVSNEDAKKIQLASLSGTLSLSLRGDNDSGKGGSGGTITLDDLLGKGKDGPVQPQCEGKVKTCTRDGVCEELCLGLDGKLSPMGAPAQ